VQSFRTTKSAICKLRLFPHIVSLGTATSSHTKPESAGTSHVFDRDQRQQSRDTPPPSQQQTLF